MRNFFLFIAIAGFFVSCNSPKTSTEKLIPLNVDSLQGKVDTPKAVNHSESEMGYGLTQEELKDDSIFIDGSIPASWAVAGITNVKGFKLFLKNLQSIVFKDEKEMLSQLIHYPLNKRIKKEADFVKNYDALFTKEVKLSIAKINFSQIFRNGKGAMIDAGKVWFAQEGNEFKIIAINVAKQ